VFVRDAALKHIDELLPGDRTAVFTTSCRTALDFTDDRAKLREAVSKIQFNPRASLCNVPMAPPVEGVDGGPGPIAHQGVQYFGANSIGEIVKRMSRLPGQRSIIFISYGLTMNPWAIRELTDLAQRNRVVIHTLNAQGVHPTAAGADVEKDPTKAEFSPTRVWGRLMAWQGMLELARATGGTYLATNDAKAAFRKLATPEWVYMLGITPGEAVVDKKTHAVKAHELKVKLTDPRKLSLQARESYYPPAGAGQQETTARQR
jgi:VWFA-related protein